MRCGERRHGPEHAEQPEAEGDHAEKVEVAAGPFAVLVQHPGRQDERGGADRHVDPEDPSPRDVGDDEAAEHDPEDGPEAPADRVVAVGPAAPLGRVQVGDHRAAVGGDERPADALEDPKADDGRLVPGQRACERAQDEDEEAHLVHAHPAEHVPEPPDLGGEQGDDEQVADDDPDDRGERYVQPSFDLRKGEDDDRRVDGGDEHPGHDHDHGEARVGGDPRLSFGASWRRGPSPLHGQPLGPELVKLTVGRDGLM